MGSIAKATENATKASERHHKTRKKNESEINNLLDEQKQKIRQLTDEYSKDPKIAETAQWKSQINDVNTLTIKIANMYKAMGQVRNEAKFLKEALDGMKDTPIAANIVRERYARVKASQNISDAKTKQRVSELDGSADTKKEVQTQREINKALTDRAKIAKNLAKEYQKIEMELTKADRKADDLNFTRRDWDALQEKIELFREKGYSIGIPKLGEEYSEPFRNLVKSLYDKLPETYRPSLEDQRKYWEGRKNRQLANGEDTSFSSSEIIRLTKELAEGYEKTQDYNKALKEWRNLANRTKDSNVELYELASRRAQELDQRQKEVNKATKAQGTEAEQAAKKISQADNEEIQKEKEKQRQAKNTQRISEQAEKLMRDINNHKGEQGQFYSLKGYNNTLARIKNLSADASNAGMTGMASMLSPSLMRDVNTSFTSLSSRVSQAKQKAQELFVQFEKTKSTTDKINFENARNSFFRLNDQLEKFNKSITQTKRADLTLENVMKRARESANWRIDGDIENAIVSFPSEMVSDVTKYELAMAGVSQVLPKVEESQKAANDEFSRFAEIGARYGQSADNVVEAARSIGRMYGQGDGDADVGARNTEILTAQAAKMATTDNFDMTAATQGLESALAQFNMQTEDSNLLMARSSHILDVWTKLAHTSGASAQDLTEGVNQAGASAREAGVSFSFLNALIATGVRTTAKSGNEIGTMLKSLFASIQSDKAIRAMQKFGIEVYKIGDDGQKHLRPIQDLILDISKGLQTTNLDTKSVSDFLLAISGGKYQVSKVSALLGNYKELKRTMDLVQDSAGFTNEQLEKQMDTVSRKAETLKANIARIFMANGNNGLLNDLKWILDILNNITKGLGDTEGGFYKNTKRILVLVAAIKLIPPLFNKAVSAVGRFRAAMEMPTTGLKSAASSKIGDAIASTKNRYQTSRDNYAQDHGIDVSVFNETSKDAKRTSTALNTLRASGRRVSTSLRILNQTLLTTGVRMREVGVRASASAVASKSLAVAGSTISGVWSTLGTVLSGAGSILRGVIGALGGWVGVAVTALSALATYFVESADSAGELANKTEEADEELQNLIVTAQEQEETVTENYNALQDTISQADELADKYNALQDELTDLTEKNDQSTESINRQNEIKKEQAQISDQVCEILHTDSQIFDEDGKINKQTIEKLAKANSDKTTQQLEDKKAEISAEKSATDAQITATQNRIDAMDKERESLSILAKAYNAFMAVLGAAQLAAAGFLKTASYIVGSKMGRAVLGDTRADDWVAGLQNNVDYLLKQSNHNLSGAFGTGKEHDLLDTEAINEKSQELDALKAKSEKLNDDWNDVTAAEMGLDYDRETHTYKERSGKVDPTENPETGDKSVDFGTPKKGKHSKTPKGKKPKWDYTAFGTEYVWDLSQQLKAEVPSFNLDAPSLMAIIKKLTGLSGTDYSSLTDPFKMGANNSFDSSFDLLTAIKNLDDGTKSIEQILAQIYEKQGITADEWKPVLGEGSDSYRKQYDDGWDFSKGRFYADPTEAAGGANSLYGTEGNYDTSQASNPFLAQAAIDTAKLIQQKTGKYIAPNMIYGAYNKETHNDTSFEMAQQNGDALGGITGNYGSYDEWLQAAADTFINGDTNGLYSNARTAEDFYEAMIVNHWKEDTDHENYVNTLNQYANEGFWHNLASNISSSFDPSVIHYTVEPGVEQEVENLTHNTWMKLQAISDAFTKQFGNDADFEPFYVTAGGTQNGHNAGSWHYSNQAFDIAMDSLKRNPERLKWLQEHAKDFGLVPLNEYNGYGNEKWAHGENFHFSDHGDTFVMPQSSGTPVKTRSTRWTAAAGEVAQYHRNFVNDFLWQFEQNNKLYEQQKKQISAQEELYGKTAKTSALSLRNEEIKYQSLLAYQTMLASMSENVKDELQTFYNAHKAIFTNNGFKDLDDFLSNDVSDTTRTEFANTFMKDNKNAQDALKSWTTLRDKNKSAKEAVAEQKNTIASRLGQMTPSASYEYQLQELDESHRKQTNGTNSNETYNIDQKYYSDKLEIVSAQAKYLQSELEKIKASEDAIVDGYDKQIEAQESSLMVLNMRQAKGEDVKKQIDELSQKLSELKQKRDNLANNHSSDYREIEKELQSVNKTLDETNNSLNEVAQTLEEKIESGVGNMFDGILLQGQTFKETWKSLWDDIAKYALQQLLKVNVFPMLQRAAGSLGGRKRTAKDAISDLVPVGVTYTNSRGQQGRYVNGQFIPQTVTGSMAGGVKDKTTQTVNGVTAQNNQQLDNLSANLNQLHTGVQQQVATTAANTAKLTASQASTQLLAVAQETAGVTQQENTLSQQENTLATQQNTSAQQEGGTSKTISAGTSNNTARTVLGMLPMVFATGGFIPRFATGGTTGEIKGAGTGTSDSILTYLSHRGQFIATSNGEYIVKKSAVDTLGVPFLDMLNNNPELVEPMKAMKRYADGGSLGENYEPVMSAKTIENYKGFNRNKAIIKMDSNKKLEQLMQQQNDMLAGMNTGSSGSVVVLNTQADSSSVMKALQKNPRAVQKILGGQKRHGFR